MKLVVNYWCQKCPYQYSQHGVKMADLSAEDLAFLKKVGQITDIAAPKVAAKKEEEK